MSATALIKSFKDLNVRPIKTAKTLFIGDKISVPKILGKKITIFWPYKINDSKWIESGNGKCLTAQIELNGNKRIIFTSAVGLQKTIETLPEESFPFTTTIIMEDDDSYTFT